MTTARSARSGKPPRTVFACQECGYETPKGLGRCPDCASWNSFTERVREQGTRNKAGPAAPPVELSHLPSEEEPRLAFGLPEFDRVLGGGVVAGSLALIGGDPGIGKSTLLLQVASLVAGVNGRPARPEHSRRVLYLSGEEAARQIKLRAARLGVKGDGLFVLTQTNLDVALREAESLSPALLIVDSIQTVYSEAAAQAPGSVAQLRQCTMDLMRWSKGCGVPVFIVGHVTKEGDIAGPRLL